MHNTPTVHDEPHLPVPLRRVLPALLALLVLGGLYIGLAGPLAPAPRGLILGVIAGFLLLFTLFRWWRKLHLVRQITWVLLILLTGAIITSVVFLLIEVTVRRSTAPTLLRDAAVIWAANVLTFAWWYWALDGGGPSIRHHHGYHRMDIVFPQIATVHHNHAWQPEFVDYLFFAFTTSTAFSPTDTLILSRRFKGLMMLQALLSLIVTGVLLARAINTL